VQGKIEERLQRIEDVQAIAELKAAYCNAADGGWNRPTHDSDRVASLFVEDGVWESGKSGRGEGRAGIKALFDTFKPAPFAFHRVSNPIIRVEGDRATGEWHALVAITFADGKALWIGGIYDDEFVRTPAGWRFRLLRFTQAFRTTIPAGWKVG
jgi:hypothetical protein